ncbi:MAG TPA: hypothetical protein VF100_01845 [Thermoanaerobaculia bacterium]
MSGIEGFLATQAGFVLAALAVSWIAVALLALTIANLHFRLARLERARPAAGEERTPFAHLLGRDLGELLGADAVPGARLALVLSSGCPACERLLGELGRTADPPPPVALLWRDAAPSPPPVLPAGAALVADGPRISAALGIGVSPFALVADGDGRVVDAAPVGRVEAFAEMLRRADAGRPATPSVAATVPFSPNLSPRPLKGVSP